MDWRSFTDDSEVIDLIPDTVTIELRKGGSITAPLKDDGRIITKNLPVEVPLRYCKTKDYDGGREALQCLGAGCIVGNHHFQPPVLGVFSMMEITNNPFPVNPGECTVIQQYHVLYFLDHREEALPLVLDWHQHNKEHDTQDQETWSLLDKAAMVYADELEKAGVDIDTQEAWTEILSMFELAGNGFEMVPGSGSSKYWYCAETMGGIVAGLGADMQRSFESLIWETPLALIGFSYGAKAKMNGAKNVKRPKDPEDVRRNMILAYLRECHGELHPWQIDNPQGHILTWEQQNHPDCVKEFQRLQELSKTQKGVA